MNALFKIDDITVQDGEPTIQDTVLAARLGYSQSKNIRQLIERHSESLSAFGLTRCTVQRVAKTSAKVFWLNERQALFIVTKSETQNAIDLTIAMVEVFAAWRAGKLAPTTKESSAVAAPAAAVFLSPELLAAVDSMVERRVGERCSPLESKLVDLMTLVRTMHRYNEHNPETARILCWLNGQSVPKDVLHPLPAPAGKGGAR